MRERKAASHDGWRVEVEGGVVHAVAMRKFGDGWEAYAPDREDMTGTALRPRRAVGNLAVVRDWDVVGILEPGEPPRADRDALAWRAGADEMRLLASGRLSERADKLPGTEAGDAGRKALLDAAGALERMALPKFPRGERPRATPEIPEVPVTPKVLTFVTETIGCARRLLGRPPSSVEIAQALADAVRARLALLPHRRLAPDAEHVATFVAGLVDRTSIHARLAWVDDADGGARLAVEVQREDGAWVAVDLGAPPAPEVGA